MQGWAQGAVEENKPGLVMKGKGQGTELRRSGTRAGGQGWWPSWPVPRLTTSESACRHSVTGTSLAPPREQGSLNPVGPAPLPVFLV